MKSNSQNSLENQLIVNFLSTTPQDFNIKSALQNILDWDYIFDTSQKHCVLPLIYKQISSTYSNLVSKEAIKKFQNKYQEIAKFNFARSTQLIKLTTQIKKQNLPIISYKGMTLAQLAYKDISLRQFTDIDLFIQKKDFFKVKEILNKMGCKPAWKLNKKQEKAVLNDYYEFPFHFGKTNTVIELHWNFIETFFAFDFDVKSIWDRTNEVKIIGKQIPTLSSEDYLVVLSSHGSKHLWRRLSWICDIDRLVRNTKIDWDVAESLAKQTGSMRMVWIGLYISNKLFSTKIPSQIEKQIQSDKTTKILGEKFIGILFKEEISIHWKEKAKLHLKMREKFGTKLKYSQRLFRAKLKDKLFMPMGRPQ